MKHIVLAVIAAAFIFTGTESFARGFSVGVFGAYSIDGGNIEKSIEEEKNCDYHYNMYSLKQCEYDAVEIPGAGAFAMYTFSNGLFIRAGAERYELKSGGDISKSVFDNPSTFYYDYEIEYKAMAFPVFFGISLSPDKGRTSFYMAAGIVTGVINIERETNIRESTLPNYLQYQSDNDTVIPGFAGILGIDKKIIGNFSVMIEYAVYKCEKDDLESGEGYISWMPQDFNYKYTETYGLPTQQLRLGVKYEF